jgi:hypothetical protein
MLTKVKTWFLGLKIWQKVVVGFVAFSFLVAPFSGGAETIAPAGDSGTAPQVTEMPVPTATEMVEPLLFAPPDWLDQETARSYSESLNKLRELGTLTGIEKLVLVEFIDFDDGTGEYGAFVEFVYDYSSNPCRGGGFEGQRAFADVMRNVSFDFGEYKLGVLQFLARAPRTDDYGNPVWVTVKNIRLSREDFTQIDWSVEDIEYGINWDKLGGTSTCE